MRIESLSVWTSSLTFSLKFAVGLIFLFIYTKYYGDGSLSADAGDFMRESKILNDVFKNSPSDFFKLFFGVGDNSELITKYLSETKHWDAGAQSLLNDNRFLLRIHSLIHFFSFQSPVIHIMIMCLVSTVASWQLFLGVRRLSEVAERYIYWILVAIPSVIFWTSGIIKEPFLFLGIALILRGFFDRDLHRKKFILILIGVLLLIAFKPYVLISAIPALLFYYLYQSLPKHKLVGSLLILFTIFSSATIIFSEARKKTVHLISRKQFDFNNVAFGGLHAYADSCFYFFETKEYQNLKISGDSVSVIRRTHALKYKLGEIENPIDVHLDASTVKSLIYYMNDQCNGYIETTPINDSFLQLVKNIPQALTNTWLRPFPWDKGGWLKFPALVEIWLMLLFLIYAIGNRRSVNVDLSSIIWSLILFCLVLSILIGLVTPVLGAISRYRIPIVFATVLISLIIINPPLKFRKK